MYLAQDSDENQNRDKKKQWLITSSLIVSQVAAPKHTAPWPRGYIRIKPFIGNVIDKDWAGYDGLSECFYMNYGYK